ncbi:mitochondrial ribosomal protein L34 [Columba livia]|uniref:Large ribosomal subunit protein bL34m n=1 Tax=Columba livia TaxID=8932 RepID=A0A2I0LIB0_COLLI|nr:mitochondrial ribosomal protein L34 [Columba livia]
MAMSCFPPPKSIPLFPAPAACRLPVPAPRCLAPLRLPPAPSRPPARGRRPRGSCQQIRARSRGNEYQPNNRKRKRTHGWIKRISTPGGVAVILRRMLKGRKSLTH